MAKGISDSKLPLLFWLILIFGAVLRLPHLNGALEYDEIWTFEHYATFPASEIFSNISLPNNHPLNSLWVKFAFVKDWPFTMRLASFLAGLGSMVLAGLAAGQLFHDRRAMLLAMLFTAIAPGLIAYSQTARGYSMQVFLLLAFANLVLAIGKRQAAVIMPPLVVCGLLAAVALPTSVLYLLPLSIYALYLMSCLAGERERMISLAAMALFAAGAGIWYFIQLENLQAAQNWSVAIRSAADCGNWLFAVALATGAMLSMLSLLMAPRNRSIQWLALLTALPLLAAVWTKAGPPRAYLMLSIFAAVAAAGAIVQCRGWKRWTLLICAIVIVAGANLSDAWHYTDWRKVYRQIAELPPHVMVVTAANDCYPLLWNNPDFLNNSGQRLKAPQALLILDDRQMLEGVNKRGETVRYPVNAPGETVEVDRIRASVYPVTAVDPAQIKPGMLYLVTVYAAPENKFQNIVSFLNQDESLIKVNPWLVYQVTQNNVVFRFLAVVIQAGDRSAGLCQKIIEHNRQYVNIYQIGL